MTATLAVIFGLLICVYMVLWAVYQARPSDGRHAKGEHHQSQPAWRQRDQWDIRLHCWLGDVHATLWHYNNQSFRRPRTRHRRG